MKKFVVLVMTVGMVLVPAAASASAHTRRRRCVVPRLAGLTLKMARGRLTHAGCRVGIIHRPKAAAGDLVVGRQAPRAGHKTRGGSKVTIWLEAKHTSSANAPTPQTLISQGLPAYSVGTTENSASNMVDSRYDYFKCTPTCAGIINLSSISPAKRAGAALTWWNSTTDFDATDDGFDGGPANLPKNFTIDGNTAAGGGTPPTTGWTTLQTVTGNKFNAGQYALNLSAYNWLRMNVTASSGSGGNTDAAWHLDVSACSSTCTAPTDTWLFLGDSITSMSLAVHPTSPPNFNQTVHAAASDFYPAGIDGGFPGWTTGNLLATDGATGTAFINELLGDFSASHFVTLALGTNDIDQKVPTSTFLSNMQTLVRDVIAKGRVPVVPTIPWASPTCGYQDLATADSPAKAGTANYDIEHDVWTMPGVVAGPDLWTFFDHNQSLINLADCPHPTHPAGTTALRKQWADWALTDIYGR